MGWFPFLFYISTYTSETYLKRFKNLVSNDRESVPRDLWDDATRQGSASMLVFAIVSLIASAFLPLMISGSKKASKTRRGSHLLHRIAPISLRNAWAISQLLFGLCLLVPAFFDEIAVIMVFVGFIGISWACTIWIPFALITTSISARNSRSYMDTVEGPQKLEAATVLALHNVAICVPQALTACLSSIIFWLSGGRENSIPLVLGFGSLAGFGAAWATRKFKTDTTLESNGVDESIAFASDTTTKPHDDDDDYE
ncbi:MAG: hypothetical protein LQ340_007040 [Diploschistes diacapsis]|nr:MAG: hypothetical protein LQ340_007040 [Diploschistes diacapsis]